MPSTILLKRGTTDKAGSYAGTSGEVIVDTGLKTLRVQDGATLGGIILADRNFVTDTVGNAVQGLNTKAACRVATTGNLTASYINRTLTNTGTLAALTIDTIALAINERVLVKNQTAASQNGIFRVSNPGSASVPWTLVRDVDADVSSELPSGTYTYVTEGAVNASIGFTLATNNPITLDTTPLVFTQFSGAGQITAGAGLTKNGNIIDIVAANSGRIVVGADSIDLAAVGTAGTYKILVVDAYGRVTGGTNPTTLEGFGITDAASSVSPALTGQPTAPTAPIGTNTTQLATTGFVQQEIATIDGGVM